MKFAAMPGTGKATTRRDIRNKEERSPHEDVGFSLIAATPAGYNRRAILSQNSPEETKGEFLVSQTKKQTIFCFHSTKVAK
jgi:hypothetical protein